MNSVHTQIRTVPTYMNMYICMIYMLVCCLYEYLWMNYELRVYLQKGKGIFRLVSTYLKGVSSEI